MNTLKFEADLARKFNYAKLPEDLSLSCRNFYFENIPMGLKMFGDALMLRTLKGTRIAEVYERIVVGDYGAFLEIHPAMMHRDQLIIKPGQEYRINDEKYKKTVKYIWYTINDGSNIKIYKQTRPVSYADYEPRMFYISVHEVMFDLEEEWELS